MTHSHKINFSKLQKNSGGVYEILLSDLADLSFIEIPYYSTVEIDGLPRSSDTYQFSISATHAGGPGNEDFTLFVHVTFRVPGDADNEAAVKTCLRRNKHIKQFFADTAQMLGLKDGPGWAPYMDAGEYLLSNVLYSRTYTRTENPVLREVIEPLVARFNDFLMSKDLLLFICHASEDKPIVELLCSFLDQQGIPVWYDTREIKVGESIVQRVEQGLDTASHVVVVLSAKSAQKPWVQRELSSTLMRQLDNASVKLLPVLIEECAIPPLIADIKYADCRVDRHLGFSRILEAIL